MDATSPAPLPRRTLPYSRNAKPIAYDGRTYPSRRALAAELAATFGLAAVSIRQKLTQSADDVDAVVEWCRRPRPPGTPWRGRAPKRPSPWLYAPEPSPKPRRPSPWLDAPAPTTTVSPVTSQSFADAEWMTYREAADRLHITVEALRSLACRQKWPRRRSADGCGIGHGRVRVLVPTDRKPPPWMAGVKIKPLPPLPPGLSRRELAAIRLERIKTIRNERYRLAVERSKRLRHIRGDKYSPGARVKRRSRERLAKGMRSLRIDVRLSEIEFFVKCGLLEPGERRSEPAISRAIYCIIENYIGARRPLPRV
jgi:hypothetical protein